MVPPLIDSVSRSLVVPASVSVITELPWPEVDTPSVVAWLLSTRRWPPATKTPIVPSSAMTVETWMCSPI